MLTETEGDKELRLANERKAEKEKKAKADELNKQLDKADKMDPAPAPAPPAASAAPAPRKRPAVNATPAPAPAAGGAAKSSTQKKPKTKKRKTGQPSSMSVDELKTALRPFGLPLGGNRAELQARLEEAQSTFAAAAGGGGAGSGGGAAAAATWSEVGKANSTEVAEGGKLVIKTGCEEYYIHAATAEVQCKRKKTWKVQVPLGSETSTQCFGLASMAKDMSIGGDIRGDGDVWLLQCSGDMHAGGHTTHTSGSVMAGDVVDLEYDATDKKLRFLCNAEEIGVHTDVEGPVKLLVTMCLEGNALRLL